MKTSEKLTETLTCKKISIDMSTRESDAQHRIFGEVIEPQGDTLLCKYCGSNYDFDNKNKISQLRALLKECKKEFTDISIMACYPDTSLTHPADFDSLFNKCENMLTCINAALGESEER